MRKIVSSSLLAVLAVAGSARAQAPSATLRPAPEAVGRLQALAEGPFGLKLEGKSQSGAAANLAGIRTETLVVSQRLDSRTYFVQDDRSGLDRPAGIFAGSDDALLARARELVVALDVPAAEIDRSAVLHETLQIGQADPSTGRLVQGETRPGQRYAEILRQVGGVPVFSSRALITLSKGGSVGSLEVHWPEVPAQVLREAQRLQEVVRAGWTAPAQPGARVESIEAGVIHSPAMGFVMDIQPAIRIIYASENPRMGRKLTLYLNDKGASVPQPRQFEQNAVPASAPRVPANNGE